MIAGFEEVTDGRDPLGGRRDPYAAAGQARRRHGVRGLFALSAADRARQHRLRAASASAAAATRSSKRVGEIAELLEIDDILDRYPASISGGQQQRASLARALVREADLYLLDEPMGQLEPQLRAILRGRIKHYLIEHSMTTVFVTHDQTEANRARRPHRRDGEAACCSNIAHAARAEGAAGQSVRRAPSSASRR